MGISISGITNTSAIVSRSALDSGYYYWQVFWRKSSESGGSSSGYIPSSQGTTYSLYGLEAGTSYTVSVYEYVDASAANYAVLGTTTFTTTGGTPYTIGCTISFNSDGGTPTPSSITATDTVYNVSYGNVSVTFPSAPSKDG